MPSVVFSFGDSSKEVDLKDINSVDDVASNMKEVMTDEQLENLTHSIYCNLMEFKKLNTGFIPDREDIIKCLDYALKSL